MADKRDPVGQAEVAGQPFQSRAQGAVPDDARLEVEAGRAQRGVDANWRSRPFFSTSRAMERSWMACARPGGA